MKTRGHDLMFTSFFIDAKNNAYPIFFHYVELEEKAPTGKVAAGNSIICRMPWAANFNCFVETLQMDKTCTRR